MASIEPHDQTAERMTNEDDGPGDIRGNEQRVEVVDAVLDGPHPTGGGIALAESGPVIAAGACEASNIGLHADPGVSGIPRARLEHDGWGAHARTRDEEGTPTDVDAVPRGPGRRRRFRRCVFPGDDPNGESKDEGDGKQGNDAPRMAAIHECLPPAHCARRLPNTLRHWCSHVRFISHCQHLARCEMGRDLLPGAPRLPHLITGEER